MMAPFGRNGGLAVRRAHFKGRMYGQLSNQKRTAPTNCTTPTLSPLDKAQFSVMQHGLPVPLPTIDCKITTPLCCCLTVIRTQSPKRKSTHTVLPTLATVSCTLRAWLPLLFLRRGLHLNPFPEALPQHSVSQQHILATPRSLHGLTPSMATRPSNNTWG